MTDFMKQISKQFAALLLAVAAGLSGPALASPVAGPERVLKSYLQAMYARDAEAAYALISRPDRTEKSLKDYRSETGAYGGAVLKLSRALAGAIRFEEMKVSVEGDRATLSFSAHLPDANDPALEPIVHGFDKVRLGALKPDELGGKTARIRELTAAGKLPFIHSPDERWELIREADGWRVFVNWAQAVEVRFDAVVMGNLGWEFTPLRSRILAKHGETIEMAYRVRNTGTRETVGKARHIIGPHAQAAHMEIISCFCFLEQTLKPGEEAELPLVFRINFDAPENIRRFIVRYEFFPLARFPSGAEG